MRTRSVRFGVITVVAALALVTAACGSTNKSGGGESSSTTAAKLTGTLKGSGATFPNSFYQQAIQVFQKGQPGLTLTYDAKGSGGGQTDLQGNLVQWAGSDDPVKSEDLPKFKGEFLYFPTVAAPITVSYNLSGVSKLQLSGETTAKIFTRAVKTWNDPAIAADNPGVTLPSTAITVVHRSDSSGTTANFTKFLASAAPSVWTTGSSKTPAWATDTTGAEKNSGVANAVKQTAGAIGYVDFADAKAAGLAFAAVKNKNGEYVAPSLDAASKAVEGASVQSNLLYDPINSAAAGAYPITAPTWVLVYKSQPDANTVANLKGWLTFLLGPGQSGAESVNFAALPSSLALKAVAQLDQISVGGGSASTTTAGSTTTAMK
ncbi:MAG: phosphate ABC transporter substrate-binding protein PstS [Acidimicrobiia bacterium]